MPDMKNSTMMPEKDGCQKSLSEIISKNYHQKAWPDPPGWKDWMQLAGDYDTEEEQKALLKRIQETMEEQERGTPAQK